ncbi:hypothetical protein ACHAPT_001480 [Fusarium lateritium]
MGFGFSFVGRRSEPASETGFPAGCMTGYSAILKSGSTSGESQEEDQTTTMVSQYSIGPEHVQAPPMMITTGGDRLPIRVVDPCNLTKTGDKAWEYEHDEFLVLDTYIWVGKKRNRDVMRWAGILGCNRFWTREQKRGFHSLVKDLKKFRPKQVTGNVKNNANRRLAKLEIMQIRVMPGLDNSWLFYSLSEEKPRIQKTRLAQEKEERVQRDQIRRETIESLVRSGVLGRHQRALAYPSDDSEDGSVRS